MSILPVRRASYWSFRPLASRWLVVPVVAFALGTTAAIAAAPAPWTPAVNPARAAAIERAADAAVARLAVATPAPTVLELLRTSAAIEGAVATVRAGADVRASSGLARGATVAALARLARLGPPTVDVPALLDRERDLELAWVAIAARSPLVRATALEIGAAALARHRRARPLCPTGTGLTVCARALERDGDPTARAYPLALRRLLDVHAMVDELRDELAGGRTAGPRSL